jgi:EmrB/QacA subfamily drug resistance transporter
MTDSGARLAGRAGMRSRGLALAVLCAATLMIILDGTIVTVALPSIQADLGFSSASLTWVMNAYMIAFGGLLLLAGRLGDLIGRARVFLAGLGVFTLASLACGLAGSPAFLIGARFVQGAGAALVSAVSLGMITGLYAEARELGRAIAAYSFTGAAGASVGLVLGGVLTQAAGWHWIFFVNLPAGVAAALAGLRVLPAEPGAGLRAGADALGAVLVTGGLMAGVYALVGTAQHGWLSAPTLGSAAAAVLLLAGFVLRQARAARPLLRLGILASRNVSGANLAQGLVIAAAFGFQVMIVLYLQRVLGYSPAAAGLGLLPTAVVIGMVSLGLSARLAVRLGARTVLLAGLVLVAAGLGLLAALPVHGSYAVHLLPGMVLFGIGGGLTLPALAMLGMASATPADAGIVSGLFNTTQQVGAAVGVALLSTLAAARTGHLMAAAGRPGAIATAAALTGGYRLAIGVGAGLAVGALAVAAIVLRPAGAQSGAAEPAAAEPAEPAGTESCDDGGAGARPREPQPASCR